MPLKLVASILATLAFAFSASAQTAEFDYSTIKSSKIAYVQPIHSTSDMDGKMMADIISRRIADISEDKNLKWQPLPFNLSEAISREYSQNSDSVITSLPESVLKPVSGLGFEYVVIIHHVTAEKKSKQTEGATTYRPLFGGITLNQDGETQVTGKMSFTTTIISVGSNSPVYVFSQTPELCGSDAEQCIAGHAVNGIIQKKQPPKPATGAEPGKPSASPSIGLYNGASAMFVMGSVLTFIGLGTVVYGNTTASISLFAAGQTGLLMCGLSNIMIRSAITSTGGVPPPGGNSAGWILHGSSVVLMGTGVGLVIAATGKGVTGNQVPVLLFSGVGTIIVGEALLPFSWIAHLKYRKKLKNVYQNISFDPVWNVDVAGRNEFGGKVTVGF